MKDDQDLVTMLGTVKEKFPEKTAFTYLPDGQRYGGHITFGSLHTRAMAIAAELQLRLPEQSRVLLCLPPGLEFIEAFLGCLYGRMQAVPVSYPPSQAEMPVLLQQIQPALAMVSPEFLEHPFLEIPMICPSHIQATAADGWRKPEWAVGDEFLYVIAQRRGGRAWGQSFTHQDAIQHCRKLAAQAQFIPADIVVSGLYHDCFLGVVNGILLPLWNETSCYLLPPDSLSEDPRLWLSAISRYRGTIGIISASALGLYRDRAEEFFNSGWDLSCCRSLIFSQDPVTEPKKSLAAAVVSTGFNPDIPLIVDSLPVENLPEIAPGKASIPKKDFSSLTATQKKTLLGDELPGIIGNVLALKREDMDSDTPLIDYGLASIQAVSLANAIWKLTGMDLSLQIFFEHMTLNLLIKRILNDSTQIRTTGTWAPEIVSEPAHQFEPFEMNDVQKSYLIGRQEDLALGSIGCHYYKEMESKNLDLKRFIKAWERLIERHETLRTVFRNGLQQVLKKPGQFTPAIYDLRETSREDVDLTLKGLRENLSHQVFNPVEWPLFTVTVSILPGERFIIHLNLDLLIMDWYSIFLLSVELEALYLNPNTELPNLEHSFREVVQAENRKTLGKAPAYWRKRLPELPGHPDLPLAKEPAQIRKPVFERERFLLPRILWENFKEQARRIHITPTAAILAAFGEILARWGQKKAFTLTMTVFGRSLPKRDTGVVLGDFTRVAYVAIDKSGPASFAAGCGHIHREMLKALEHQSESAIQAVRELGGSLENNGFPIVFTSALGLSTTQCEPFDWIGEEVFAITQTPQVWLDHQTLETSEGLVIIWDYVRELFPAGMIEDMFTAYTRLLEELARPDCSWQEPAAVRLPESQLAVRALANDTSGHVPHRLLHELFLEQVKRQPDAPAVIGTAGTTSYSLLDRMSSAIAARLQGYGVKPNTLVAVALRKDWLQIAAVLGVLKAGAAYLPLDPDLPLERRRSILEQAQTEIILIDSDLQQSLLWPEPMTLIAVNTLNPEEAASSGAGLVQSPDDLAYVIFTSGSTGTPKGVMITHRGAVNTILDLNARFSMNARDRVLALSALNFDLSVYDIFGMLACGGAIVMPDPGLRREPSHWHQLMENAKVTLWNSVPALMEMYAAFCGGREIKPPAGLRLVWLSGDWIPVTLPERIRSLKPDLAVFSLGGATETSIWSIIYPIVDVNPGWKSIPYGKPLKNQTFHVFDHFLRDCPQWVPGRIYTGGVGVAKGYWNDPERTSERFINHPESGERLYWTGDLGRYLPDGNIEFLGREDFQVKIRGYRIELEEIEAVLLQHSSVQSIAVSVHRTPGGIQRLVAYVVGRNGLAPVQSELQAFVSARLPNYMVPTFWVTLPSLPLSANGKVDRQALPDPLAFQVQSAETKEDNPLVEPIVEICRELLGNDSVTGESHFFELGGDSLLATALTAVIEKRLGIRIRLNAIFEQPILSRLAQTVQALLGKEPENKGAGFEPGLKTLKSEAAGRFDPFPLTDVQYAYWVGRSHAFELGNAACQGYMEYEAQGLNPQRFEAAWRKAVKRHDMLRAKICPDGTQVVERECPLFQIPILDLTGLSSEKKAAQLEKIRWERSHLILPTHQAPLFSVALTRLGQDLWRVHINIDLLVMDFWSYLLLEQELSDYYQDPHCEKDPLVGTFRDYIMRRKADERRQNWDYWQNRCHKLPPAPRLPLCKSLAEVKQPRTVRYRTDIRPQYWKRLCERARSYGITPTMTVLTAFADVIRHWSLSERFTLNLTLFNRDGDHPELNEIIGDFTSINLLGFDYEGAKEAFYQRAQINQKQLWEDLDHQEAGGVRVLRELARISGMSSFQSIVPVVFTSTLNLAVPLRKPVFSWLGRSTFTACQTPQVYFDHQVTEDTEGLHCSWDIVEELFPAGMIAQMRANFEAHLLRLAFNEDSWRESEAFESWNREPAAVLEQTESGAIDDPLERLAFKLQARGIRRDDFPVSIPLIDGETGATGSERWIRRRSYRKFNHSQRLSLQQLGRLLGRLGHRKFEGYPLTKKLYSSAGGLYPVQIHVYIKPDKIEGLDGGIYYYNPVKHSLDLSRGNCTIPGAIFEGTNVSIFNNASFVLFLIADLDAIRPLYHENSRNFCFIEAGIISHLLESECITEGIGLCQMGALPFAKIAAGFNLKSSHLYLHALVGGPISPVDTTLNALVAESVPLVAMMERLDLDGTLKSAQGDQLEMDAHHNVSNQGSKKNQETAGQILQSIFADLLDTSSVDIHTNFFDLGGNSLMAVQAVNLIRQRLGVEVSVVQMFEYPTIGALAGLIGKTGAPHDDQLMPAAGADDLYATPGRKLKEHIRPIKREDVR